jgi:hypothetical protein
MGDRARRGRLRIRSMDRWLEELGCVHGRAEDHTP